MAQAVQAAQVTIEDYAMEHVGLAPLQVVGYEGLLVRETVVGAF